MSTPSQPDRYIVAESLSEAWIAAVRLLNAIRDRVAVHLIVRILNPTREIPSVRKVAQGLIDTIDARGFPDIATTRNTIFPATWARKMPDPDDLSAYYRLRYTSAGLLGFPGNEHGTYFGRIVAYPRTPDTSADQLTDTVRKIRTELSTAHPKSSRYEINIYNEALDRSPMGFPCLAHLSLHLHDQRLHMQAIYRNEHMVARAYGNYLGLAELQRYIAAACSVAPGELLVTIGHVKLDAGRTMIAELLQALTVSGEGKLGDP